MHILIINYRDRFGDKQNAKLYFDHLKKWILIIIQLELAFLDSLVKMYEDYGVKLINFKFRLPIR